MNETVLGLLSAITIYGLASLALPQANTNVAGDAADLTADAANDEAPNPASAEEADLSQTG